MQIETKIKLKPFRTPNFVIVDQPAGLIEEGFKELPKYALAELDAATLDLLCVQFREDIFEKAGKPDPDQHRAGE